MLTKGEMQHLPLHVNEVVLEALKLVRDELDSRDVGVQTELAPSLPVIHGDRGTGVAPEKLEAIFEPFFTTKSQGLGLGLALCRTIITSHGGKLWVTNNGGPGATFHVSLPPRDGGRD